MHPAPVCACRSLCATPLRTLAGLVPDTNASCHELAPVQNFAVKASGGAGPGRAYGLPTSASMRPRREKGGEREREREREGGIREGGGG